MNVLGVYIEVEENPLDAIALIASVEHGSLVWDEASGEERSQPVIVFQVAYVDGNEQPSDGELRKMRFVNVSMDEDMARNIADELCILLFDDEEVEVA